ncbi:YeiH family protein [Staphylococcus saprophyticus]|uniref:YeiH family protein n=1 Tax=Staphylococcus saprophyticus TaxID=29385 RepID=UPI0011A1AF9F|nr:YeiH family protein [Staphylococcus saprophyticus]MBU8681296.1 YeiH family protein [Staphylococcus saprophyticus]MDW3802877.1 YeiH family protein [Staphylococcus saprophyticus]MDW4093111.1 YeiH family protein [Staphylococcus saprophyticus]MDW4320226.1 YeiH family protein [Staphylococcus saprophyticus]MVA84770.1 putative sulfate exporter family transporter [Staphylococcus saprophyticus]
MDKARGLIMTLVIAMVATIMGSKFPIIGSAIFAIIIGILINNIITIPKKYDAGIKFSSKKILHYSIVVLGFTLSFQSIGAIGWRSLPIIFVTLFAAALIVYVLMKLFNINEHLSILIGVGTSICGGSAIAATSPVIKAKESEVAFAISTIFLFNLIAVFIFPPIGHIMHMGQATFGYFGGTAINDTSSVIAATSNYGKTALETGAVVKLTRTLMIIPVVLFFTYRTIKKEKEKQSHTSIAKIFPWFIVWFVIASLISTIFNFSPSVIHMFQQLSLCLITIAMAGIGLNVDFKQFRQAGIKPILLGLVTWIVVIITSLITMKLINLL